MSSFEEKYRKVKAAEARRGSEANLDPVESRKQHDKADYLFTLLVAKKIFDYNVRHELIEDFKILSLAEKKDFLKREYGVDPDSEMVDLKAGELKHQQYNESKRDLKVPVCRNCGKAHNPFETCFG
jgi:hypothetical protein